jgi:hypothetical protein
MLHKQNTAAAGADGAGKPAQWLVLTLPNRPGLCLKSILDAIRRELQLHHRLGLAFHYPRNAVARVAFRLAHKPNAGVPFGAQGGDFSQISLAALALHAGWEFRALARHGLRRSVGLATPVSGLPHGLSFR